MSAAAGGLEVVLEKVGHYRLGEGLAKPQAADIARSSRLLSISIVLGLAVGAAAALFLPKAAFSGRTALRQGGSRQV